MFFFSLFSPLFRNEAQLLAMCRAYGGDDGAMLTSAFCFGIDSLGFDVMASSVDATGAGAERLIWVRGGAERVFVNVSRRADGVSPAVRHAADLH